MEHSDITNLQIDTLPSLSLPDEFTNFLDDFENNVLTIQPAPSLDFNFYSPEDVFNNLQSDISTKSPTTTPPPHHHPSHTINTITSPTSTVETIPEQTILPTKPDTQHEDLPEIISEVITISPEKPKATPIIIPKFTINKLPFPFPVFPEEPQHQTTHSTSPTRKHLLPTPPTTTPASKRIKPSRFSSTYTAATKDDTNDDLRSLITQIRMKHQKPDTTNTCSVQIFTTFKSSVLIPTIFPYNSLQLPKYSTNVQISDLSKPETFRSLLLSLKDFCLRQPPLHKLALRPEVTAFLQPTIMYPTSQTSSTTLQCNPDALPFIKQPLPSPYFISKQPFVIMMKATFTLPQIST